MKPYPHRVSPMFKNRGIAFKLVVFSSFGSILVFFGITLLFYRYSSDTLRRNAHLQAETLLSETVYRIEAVLLPVQQVPKTITAVIGESVTDTRELIDVLKENLSRNPEIYGMIAAFEPYAFNSVKYHYAPYVFRNEESVELRMLGGPTYDYFRHDWYLIPKELNRAMWSEPYYDDGGGDIIMATYSVPLSVRLEGKRKFAGIVTADISIEWLRNEVSKVKILKTGYGFLISRNGTFVTHPEKSLIMHMTLFDIAEQMNDLELREIGKMMIRGERGIVPYTDFITGKKSLLYFAPIPAVGWSLAVSFPEDELSADITSLANMTAYLLVAGLFLVIFLVLLVTRSITRPLIEMVKATQAVAGGNLDAPVPALSSNDEIGKLAHSFRFMQDALKDYIRELTEVTASRERFESELKIAKDIQLSILPKIFPPFPSMPFFDIFAMLRSAREVGGDLYDFYLTGEKSFFFVIGDVSGKGVPASLYMAVTKTLLKTTANRGLMPDEVLTHVNNELCHSSETAMFVTLFCGMLDCMSGQVVFSSAGHNPPLVIRKNGEIVFLEQTGGAIAGYMEEITFGKGILDLSPGDSLFLYTDGVTEAMNEKGELFGEERLVDCLRTLEDRSVKGMIDGVLGDVARFEDGAQQSDDITMMVIRYNGTGDGV